MLTFTVATSTYNRAHTLHRVYDSLKRQTFKDFEWIIVDDGSTDNTKELAAQFQSEADFAIRYFYKENGGKHTGMNLAVKEAKGELFIMADSDDGFKKDSLQILIDKWSTLSREEQKSYRGVTCLCYDPQTNNIVGRKVPEDASSYLGNIAVFKYRLDFDMWGFNRTDVMREFPYPEYDSDNQKLKYFPEAIIWHKMGEKYKIMFLNEPLLAYYQGDDQATSNNTFRSRENFILWEHDINDMLKYFWYWPKLFLKAFAGLSMDGLLLNKGFAGVMKTPNSFLGKLGVLLFFPVGAALAFKKCRKNNFQG